MKIDLRYFANMENFSVGYQKITTILILLLSVNPAFTGYSWSVPSLSGKNHRENSIPKGSPQFDETVTSDISVALGQTAYLPCVVHNLGDKLVSWIRSEDLHILTHGKFTFTADARFESVLDPDTESWTLKIIKVRSTDAGKYECQVNTDPKMNMFFRLHIRETPLQDSPVSVYSEGGPIRASISGPHEQFVKTGSTVTFECKLEYGVPKQNREKLHTRFSTRSVPNVQWLKDGLAISFQAERGGISVETERGENTGSSRLTLASVGSGDSGQYTCGGLGIKPSTVTLNVIEGEYTEAMQRDDYSAITSASKSYLLHRYEFLIQDFKISYIFLYNIIFMLLIHMTNVYWHDNIYYNR